VREGEHDDNFAADIDRVWAKDRGWPKDIILTFPDIGK
jgi:hypothetical protein